MKKSDFVILDGAMGTMLQKKGLPVGKSPELWNIEKPEIIADIAEQYINAGSNIVYANTFGANRYKLKGADVSAVIKSGILAAKSAARGTTTRVALDIGPIGQLLKPLGTLEFDTAYDIFKEQVIAGQKAGADLVVFETMSDLYEVKAAILAAKENTKLPIWVTMTFEKNGRTFLGTTVQSFALTAEALGVDAIGFNCSLGPTELLPLIKELKEWTSLPVILKPNAGLPDPITGEYSLSAKEFAKSVAVAADLGVTVFGGCCGTTPEFIAELKTAIQDKTPVKPTVKKKSGVCSATKAVDFDGVRVIGERINPTGKKRFREALKENDISYIVKQGIEQQDAFADILDVNVGLPGIDEAEMLKTVVTRLQEVIDLPLQLDSSSASALEKGLRYYNGKPIVNSVNGEQESLDKILPLCKKYGAAVIGLTMDKNGIPKTATGRIKIAERILLAAESFGIPKEDVIIDCLTLTVSAEQESAKETLKAVEYVSRTMGLNTTLGVSNISFGLPSRETVTSAFLTSALAMGLNLPIINPNSTPVMDAVFAHRVISGEDTSAVWYIERFANQAELSAPKENKSLNLDEAVLKGLREETAALVSEALKQYDCMSVINNMLIPALDKVGELYEKGSVFLPQLISSASAAAGGFEVIKTRLALSGERTGSKGKIIVATVKGDIHDIGKNIVKVVLENYGFTVIDLGRDVEPKVIVDTAIKQNVKLIGLSALMTTTTVSMKETVEALKNSGHDCKIWVGGAVVTADFAKEIGADYYARDAKQSADIAREVFS